MTEPENFDDDLFADLYNDDEPTTKLPEAAPQPPALVPDAISYDYDNAGTGADQNGGHDAQMNEEYEEDDDDVDFNLGNDSATHRDRVREESPVGIVPPPPPPVVRGPNSKEDGKMFIGGLNWETTDQSLRDYFSQFGEVIECTVMRDGATGRSRGFGFLTFKDPKTVNTVMVKEHHLDGKIIDPKRAIPRDEQEKTSKIFVGGVSQDTTDAEFREYFSQFGRVIDSTLMMDKDTGRPRGFGFVTFESEAGVENCLQQDLEIHGKPIEVKKAQPRGNLREEEEANRRGGGAGKFRKGGAGGGMGDQESAGQQMGAAGGMTPQVMAQYWQRMQQYFAMMQQQVAMSRGMGMGGMNMNPAMMQMMQMQQMQQMMQQQQGRGGVAGGNPMAAMGNMNPQMMQQMQQMMAQQQGGGPAGPNGGGNRAGYGAMEQQMFEEQKYDQQQQQAPAAGRRGGSANPGQGQQQQQQQQQFNQGGYGMGGGGAAPTSWEGMYDDVPQPNMNQGGRGGFGRNRGGGHQHQQQAADPVNAPPANAPTGPKNAGRPGANYRGGGRGGNRGFHPYSRG